jgi:hypothetical protein
MKIGSCEEKHLYILEPPKPRGCKFCIQKKIWKKSGERELFQWDAILDAEVTIILFSSVAGWFYIVSSFHVYHGIHLVYCFPMHESNYLVY